MAPGIGRAGTRCPLNGEIIDIDMEGLGLELELALDGLVIWPGGPTRCMPPGVSRGSLLGKPPKPSRPLPALPLPKRATCAAW